MADVIARRPGFVVVKVNLPVRQWDQLRDVARGEIGALIAVRKYAPWLLEQLALKIAQDDATKRFGSGLVALGRGSASVATSSSAKRRGREAAV